MVGMTSILSTAALAPNAFAENTLMPTQTGSGPTSLAGVGAISPGGGPITKMNAPPPSLAAQTNGNSFNAGMNPTLTAYTNALPATTGATQAPYLPPESSVTPSAPATATPAPGNAGEWWRKQQRHGERQQPC